MTETTAPPSNAQFQYILPHPDEPKIALMPTDDGWCLPSQTPGTPMGRYYQHYVDGYKTRRLWDWQVITLYQADYFPKPDFNDVVIVYVLENSAGRSDLPDGGRWFGMDDLASLTLADAHLAPLLHTYFTVHQTDSIPELRAPWARTGWYQQTMAWLQAQLTRLGYTQTGEVEIVRVWCITALYRVPTTAGNLYLKAVPPTFAREIGVTRWLRQQFGTQIPEIIAADSDQRLLLMTDFGGITMREQQRDTPDAAFWQRTFREYGQLQAATAAHTATLLDLGAMDYRLDTLLPRFEAVLFDDDYVHPNWEITAEQIAAVRQLLPAVTQHIDALTALNLPDTIVHGDFHAGNINVNEGRLLFYDWTDATVGLPLLDLYAIATWDLHETFPDDPDTVTAILDAYFDALGSIAAPQRWQTAYPHARIASIVANVINYQQLLSSVEPNERWILNVIPEMLLALLKAVDAES